MALKYPPWTLPLILAFWGWRGDAPIAAAALLLLIALAGRLPWRWPLEDRQYHRLGDLTTVLFLGAIGYSIGLRGDSNAVYVLLRWLPALFSPLLLAQLYSAEPSMPLGALFYSLRRTRGNASPRIDFRLPYAALAALAAGHGQAEDGVYFIGIAGFALWTLWCNRPRRQPAPLWLLAFALAAAAGYAGQLGLTRLQGLVEEWSVAWFIERNADADPFRARTAIGDIGRLKLSTQIVLRIAPSQPLTAPLLLKEAAYDRYQGQAWTATQAAFKPYVLPKLDAPRQLEALRIGQPRNSLLVPLPSGLRGLFPPPQAGEFQANRLGAVKWLDPPPVLRYRVAYDPQARDATPPTAEDLALSKPTADLLLPLAEQLGLKRLPAAEAAAAVGRFFAGNFGYSLNLGDAGSSTSALRDFLYRRRSGHCEYFAAATALLLRTAGVPTRFAVGYSVDEYSPEERLYLVRLRHAHAWTEAYIDGAWVALDNTPAVWAEEEAEADPWWQGWADAWSRWITTFRVWRWEQAQAEEKDGFPLWGWLVLPLSGWLGWRLYRSRKAMAAPTGDSAAESRPAPADPAYARLEQTLERAGHPPRDPGEPPLCWLRRIGRGDCESEVREYYRRRFGAAARSQPGSLSDKQAPISMAK
jgi:transglutaminase-like putative cysteine protease